MQAVGAEWGSRSLVGDREKGVERKRPQHSLWTVFATYRRRSLLLLLVSLFFIVVAALPHTLTAVTFLATRFLHRASMSPPTSLWKGEGRVRLGRSAHTGGLMVEPTGSWPYRRTLFGGELRWKGGGGGGGKRKERGRD
jgi:hypothetical protein